MSGKSSKVSRSQYMAANTQPEILLESRGIPVSANSNSDFWLLDFRFQSCLKNCWRSSSSSSESSIEIRGGFGVVDWMMDVKEPNLAQIGLFSYVPLDMLYALLNTSQR